MKKTVFFSQLESLRGIAALIVVIYHTPFVNGQKWSLIEAGSLFVDLFFVLSGFVMAHAYSARIAEGMSVLRFATLRLARLYPLHIGMLIVWLGYVLTKVVAIRLFGLNITLGDEVGLVSFILNLFLLHSMGFADHLSWNTPSWSISVEFFTYLLFFLVISFTGVRRISGLLFVIVVSYTIIIAVSGISSSRDLLVTYDFGFFRCAGSFFVGVIVYRLQDRYSLRTGVATSTVIEFASILLTVYVVSSAKHDMAWQFAAILCFALLIYVFSRSKGQFCRLLDTPVFRYLGKISYSIYMVHAIILTISLNVAEVILRWPIDFIPGTSTKRIETAMALPINTLIIILVIGFSHLTWRWIEVPGQLAGRQLVERLFPSKKSVQVVQRGTGSV